MTDCDELLDGLDVLAEQSDQLIRELNVPVMSVPKCPYGSHRYQKVSNALDSLTYAEVQLTESKRTDWDRAKVGTRYGSDLVQRLKSIKTCLQGMGEGAPQPKP